MKESTIQFLKRHLTLLKWVSIAVNITAWVTLILWVIDNTFYELVALPDQESIFVLLTAIYALLNKLYKWLLSDSEYSPGYALATGYLSNFLLPTITQLIENGENHPVIYIYKVETIADLSQINIDRAKAKIKNDNFKLEQINLDLKNARARDIMQITKSQRRRIYFDIPNTILSLNEYIDYKVSSGRDESSTKQKTKFTNTQIEKFYKKLDELLAENDVSNNVKYCGKELEFIFG